MFKSKMFLSLFFMLTLTACGVDVSVPEENATNSGAAMTGSGAEMGNRTCEIEEYDRCVSQFKLVSNDLKAAMLKTQKTENALAAYKQKELDAKNDDPRLNEILKTYTEVAEQKEFSFDVCGKVGVFEKQAWFADFQTALETKGIPFVKAGRNLQAIDFTGGCSSSEGKIAFFLGSETEGNMGVAEMQEGELIDTQEIFEFHLIKFNTENKTLEEVLMAKGICEDDYCPAVFNKREGAYIPMVGIGANQECNYRYFFEQNILIKDGCNEK